MCWTAQHPPPRHAPEAQGLSGVLRELWALSPGGCVSAGFLGTLTSSGGTSVGRPLVTPTGGTGEKGAWPVPAPLRREPRMPLKMSSQQKAWVWELGGRGLAPADPCPLALRDHGSKGALSHHQTPSSPHVAPTAGHLQMNPRAVLEATAQVPPFWQGLPLQPLMTDSQRRPEESGHEAPATGGPAFAPPTHGTHQCGRRGTRSRSR